MTQYLVTFSLLCYGLTRSNVCVQKKSSLNCSEIANVKNIRELGEIKVRLIKQSRKSISISLMLAFAKKRI